MNIEEKLKLLPIIEYFKIEGLYGYKNIAIYFEKNVKIVAADNGAGKTTLLHSLYSILQGDIEDLVSLNFQQIHLKFTDHDKTFTLTKEHIIPKNISIFLNELNYSPKITNDLINVTKEIFLHSHLKAPVEQNDYLALWGKYASNPFGNHWTKTALENKIKERTMLNRIPSSILTKLSDLIIEDIEQKKSHLNQSFMNDINSFLTKNNVTVLYQPTFRRIEKNIKNFFEDESEDNEDFLETASTRIAKNRDLIKFGLDDVRKNLNTICRQIRSMTLQGYNKLSGNILELSLSNRSEDTPEYSLEEYTTTLKLALHRLGKTTTDINRNVESLSRKYNQDKNSDVFMFLSQLIPVFDQSNDLEQKINAFKDIVNSYLESSDSSEKKFIFDTNKVTANVINDITNEILNLNSLSSGEKQIFSIFSKLYLESDPNKKYIILFDEPELSLSIEWQKKFLPDVYKAPGCKQLFAITHSPFIFKNELKQYAGSINVENKVIAQ